MHRCYDAMVRCYGKMLGTFWSKHTLEGSNKFHEQIAALICDEEGKLPYTAVLGTGTLHRDKRCAHEDNYGCECSHCTCDGHAESIIYEGAPKYFMEQMVHSVKEKEMSDSIFDIIPSSEGHLKFKLKPNIKFYLMVTGPPCGFIQNQKDPCMEWKLPFLGYPHVPTCSSRILIGGTMGIQGYVSHLLVEPIFIDSVIILCTKDAEHQRINFSGSFPLPQIRTREYNPKDFASFKNQQFIQHKDSEARPSTTDTNTNIFSENIAVTSCTSSNGTKYSTLSIASAYKDGFSYLAINPLDGVELSGILSFCTANKDIDDCLIIDESVKKERKATMEEKYTKLCDRLELKNALLRHTYKLEADVKKGKTKATFVDDATISKIEELLLNNGKLIMDCTWDCYFRIPSDIHPTDS